MPQPPHPPPSTKIQESEPPLRPGRRRRSPETPAENSAHARDGPPFLMANHMVGVVHVFLPPPPSISGPFTNKAPKHRPPHRCLKTRDPGGRSPAAAIAPCARFPAKPRNG
eukprot:gene19660-biopygen23508